MPAPAGLRIETALSWAVLPRNTLLSLSVLPASQRLKLNRRMGRLWIETSGLALSRCPPRKKPLTMERSSSFSSLVPFRAHAGNTAPSLPSGQRRGQATSPEQKFFRGWGRGGRGSFYQKTPLPPQRSPTPSSPPDTQPRSQWPGWTSRHVPSLSSSGQGRISLRRSNRGSGTGMAESRARV